MEDRSYKNIIDETNQMIQVSNKDTFEMLYANRPAIEYAKHSKSAYKGRKCYEYMMGRKEQCPFCPLRELPKGQDSQITEMDNGTQVFTVKTKLLKWEGQDAFAEYATDITPIKRAQERYRYETERLLKSIPNAQSVFQLNLSQNRCFYIEGHGEKEKGLAFIQKADELLKSLAENFVHKNNREEFTEIFNVDAMIGAYENGKTEVYQEMQFWDSHQDIQWVRVTARIMLNPDTGDMECIFYAINISDEKAMQSKMIMFEEALKRDAYTGLYTKTAFEQLCNEYLEANKKEAFAVVFVDLDHLKTINDTMGHLIGDKAIMWVAKKIQTVFSNLDIVARFGGDEFVILVKEITLEVLENRLMLLLQSVRRAYRVGEQEVNITCSIGAIYCDEKQKDYYELLDMADKALYQAKNAGRDCCSFL